MKNSAIRDRNRAIPWSLFAWSLATLVGCKMTAPMHTWKSPKVPKTGVVRVAIAPIGGHTKTTQRLQDAMKQTQPNPNPLLTTVYPEELSQIGGIQLVSYDNQPNDMATVSAARRAGLDYVLQGYVMHEDIDTPPQDPQESKRFRIFRRKKKVEQLTVHWTVIDVNVGTRIQAHTVSMNRLQAEKKHPDLRLATQPGDDKVIMATARESWSLVAPINQPMDAVLDLPWVTPGSSQVRKGNGFAKQGRWDMAEKEWQEAVSLHPWNTAGWKNLSLAAVAREDFQLARDRLKHAETFWPGDATFPTLSWIEQRQRDHYQSLSLPPPAEGWTLADPQKSIGPKDVPHLPPK